MNGVKTALLVDARVVEAVALSRLIRPQGFIARPNGELPLLNQTPYGVALADVIPSLVGRRWFGVFVPTADSGHYCERHHVRGVGAASATDLDESHK